MVTSIQVSDELLERLKNMKIKESESYEDIIWDLIEDHLELSTETKESINQSEREIKEGKLASFEEVKSRVYNKIHTGSRKTTK